MKSLRNSLQKVLEAMDDVAKRYDLEKEFKNTHPSDDEKDKEKIGGQKEPKADPIEKDPILRKIEEIKNGKASLEELEELIKNKDKENK